MMDQMVDLNSTAKQDKEWQ